LEIGLPGSIVSQYRGRWDMQMTLEERGRPEKRESVEAGTGSSEPEESDEAIIARVLHEDINAYELLVRRYSRFVFGIVAEHVNRGYEYGASTCPGSGAPCTQSAARHDSC
jgi:hypothetical protein